MRFRLRAWWFVLPAAAVLALVTFHLLFNWEYRYAIRHGDEIAAEGVKLMDAAGTSDGELLDRDDPRVPEALRILRPRFVWVRSDYVYVHLCFWPDGPGLYI